MFQNVFSLALVLCFASASGAERPNVVLIVVDDLGWKDLGCYGSSFHDTPHVDALAREGTLFTQAYSASPVCSPSRAAILTGRHPVRVGITDWIPGVRDRGRLLRTPEDLHALPLEEETLAEMLREAGYATHFVGKWHLGGKGSLPTDHGFDSNIAGLDRGSPPGGYTSPYNNPFLNDGPEGEHLTDRLANESVRIIESAGQDPFFLMVSFYTVHTPIEGHSRYDELYAEKAEAMKVDSRSLGAPERRAMTRTIQSDPGYAAMVRSMDDAVGRILEAIDANGYGRDTLLIFTSDNGGLSTRPPQRMGPTSVRPLRAGKGWCYEGGIRVPLIIRDGSLKDQPLRVSILVTGMDLMPTIRDRLDLPASGIQSDGRSLLSDIQGGASSSLSDRTAVWHYPHYHGTTWTPGSAIRVGNWKLIEFYEENTLELYDLSYDLSERHDLSLFYPELAGELQNRLRTKLESLGAKWPSRR